MEAEHVLNRLWIGQAEKSDSGNYSCTIPGYEKTNFPRARVRVHVMDGKLSLVKGLFKVNLEFSFSIPGLFQTWNSKKPDLKSKADYNGVCTVDDMWLIF